MENKDLEAWSEVLKLVGEVKNTNTSLDAFKDIFKLTIDGLTRTLDSRNEVQMKEIAAIKSEIKDMKKAINILEKTRFAGAIIVSVVMGIAGVGAYFISVWGGIQGLK